MPVVSARISSETYTALEAYCKEERRNKSDVVGEAVCYFLDCDPPSGPMLSERVAALERRAKRKGK